MTSLTNPKLLKFLRDFNEMIADEEVGETFLGIIVSSVREGLMLREMGVTVEEYDAAKGMLENMSPRPKLRES